MPLIAYYFNIISPITVIANLFIVPISGAILFVGILFATLGAIFGQAAFILGNVLHLLLSVSIKIMAFLSSVPFAYFYIPRLPLCAFAAYYLLVLTLSRKNLLKLNWFRIVISGLFIVLTILSTNIFAATDKLRVSFLDIVGGSVFLELPNRKTLLIDAGRDLNSFTHSGRNIVAPFIWSRGRGSIDIAMLAQSDISHQGAMRSVMERISVKYFISGQLKNDNTFYNKTENFMASRKINRIVVKDAIVIDMPDTDIKIYAIKVSVNKKALRKETVLSDQLIIRLVYKDFILLLCPSEIEKYLNEVLVYWPRPQASVIAVQYHRLKQKGRISAQRFYETIRPKVIIVNSKSRKAEKGTDYSDMLAVKNKDSKIFSTDNLGAITIITDGHSYSLESFKPA
jgi:competence protein ComEC